MKDYEVRDGQRVVPTCAECGCRLQNLEDGTSLHFQGESDKDARGCICPEYWDFFMPQ